MLISALRHFKFVAQIKYIELLILGNQSYSLFRCNNRLRILLQFITTVFNISTLFLFIFLLFLLFLISFKYISFYCVVNYSDSGKTSPGNCESLLSVQTRWTC